MALQTKQNKRLRFLEDLKKKQNMDVDDIVRDQSLSHLPAKSLVRFRAVCRDWNLWITNPFFIHSQSYSFRRFSGLFRQSNRGTPSFISLDPTSYGIPDPSLSFFPEPVGIKSSSNGLLCCQGFTGEKGYYICNPMNKQWKKLPKPNHKHGVPPAIVLVFEPSIFNFAADYKLICCFPSSDIPGSLEFEIYSSETRSWSLSKEICFNQKEVLLNSGVYLNGNVYWQTLSGSMLEFDPINEHCRILKKQNCGNKGILMELNGQLCYAKAFKEKVDLFVADLHSNTKPMNRESSSYHPKDSMTISLDRAIVGDNLRNTRVLPSVGSDVLIVHVGEMIVSYHMLEKKCRVMSSWGNGENDRYIPYVNSLVSVSSI